MSKTNQRITIEFWAVAISAIVMAGLYILAAILLLAIFALAYIALGSTLVALAVVFWETTLKHFSVLNSEPLQLLWLIIKQYFWIPLASLIVMIVFEYRKSKHKQI